MPESQKAPRIIPIIAIVNGVAAVLHIVVWSLAFLKLPWWKDATSETLQMDLLVTYGLGIADLVWSTPLLAFAAVYGWKRKQSGWLAAQMANVLWGYSFTFILFREISLGAIRPGTMLLFPFAVFALCSAVYLWKYRRFFD